MDLTTAVNLLGSDYVNKVSDLLTNKRLIQLQAQQMTHHLIRWIVPIHIFSRRSRA